MKTTKIKESVKLRTKELKNGNKSLYLDIYFQGVRRYEFLKLYLKPETRANKIENQETMRLALAIKAKRIVDLQNRKYGFNSESQSQDADFLKFMVERAIRAQKKTLSTKQGVSYTARRTADYLRMYSKTDTIPFYRIDKEFVIGFVDWLKKYRTSRGTPLKPNTIDLFFSQLVAGLNSAVKKRIINASPIRELEASERPKKDVINRPYLTIDEVQAIYDVDYPASPYTKQLFLFGCMSGLRYSDIIALRWRDLEFRKDGKVLATFKQKKTEQLVSATLSESAIKLLPSSEGLFPDDFVFGTPIKYTGVKYHLEKIVEKAGIKKKITFHTSRHTFATMLLTLGADLYTVSKLLGHSSIKTTQIYADVVDQKKQDAVALIPVFNG